MVQDTGGVLSLVQEENTSLSQLLSSPVSPPPLHPIPHPSEAMPQKSKWVPASCQGNLISFCGEGGEGEETYEPVIDLQSRIGYSSLISWESVSIWQRSMSVWTRYIPTWFRLKWFMTDCRPIRSWIIRLPTDPGLFRPDLLVTLFRLISFGLEESRKVL